MLRQTEEKTNYSFTTTEVLKTKKPVALKATGFYNVRSYFLEMKDQV